MKMGLTWQERESIQREIDSGKKLVSVKWLIWLWDKIQDAERESQ